MKTKIFHCNKCDFDFERIIIDEEKEDTRCPLCGEKDIILKEELEKKSSCDTNSKYS